MSELGDLESAVVSLIAGITSGGSPAFQSVEGFSDTDRRASVAQVRRRLAPAALVVFGGRVRADVAESVAGVPKLTVLIAAGNLRGGDDPRAGDGTALGGFDLLGLVMAALDGTIVDTDRRLSALDEQIVSADETSVVYEQRYLVDRVTELSSPTFNGQVLAGSDSLVNVIVGELTAETVAFAFPGIDGVFRHHLGTRGRPIRWRGQLRASSDSGLSTIESTIEAMVASPNSFDMVDSWSRTFADCVADRFVRTGPRRRHPVSGYALQPFEIHFTQLNP